MINCDKWINSLPQQNIKIEKQIGQIDPKRWENTIPKKNAFGSVIKYLLTTTLFVMGLFVVSAVKNETRSIQKEINNLQAAIDSIQLDLHQSMLDYEVLTSPENISRLAAKNLDMNLVSYKKSQIIDSNYNENEMSKFENKNLTKGNKIKVQIAKKIEQKKTELKKLQEMYSQPKKIPNQLRMQVAQKIKNTQIELKKLYEDPVDTIGTVRIQRWAAVQVIKAFLGMPIIPGK